MPDSNAQVRALIERLVAEGPEVGLQVAAYLDGRLVIDAWGRCHGRDDAQAGGR